MRAYIYIHNNGWIIINWSTSPCFTQKTSEIKQLGYKNLTFQRLGPERYLRHELLQHQHGRIHFLLAETYRLKWLKVLSWKNAWKTYRLMGTQMMGWKGFTSFEFSGLFYPTKGVGGKRYDLGVMQRRRWVGKRNSLYKWQLLISMLDFWGVYYLVLIWPNRPGKKWYCLFWKPLSWVHNMYTSLWMLCFNVKTLEIPGVHQRSATLRTGAGGCFARKNLPIKF